MIDKIGVNSVNHVKASKPEATKPTFKGQDELPQIEELRGSELLANYSVAFINKMPKEKFGAVFVNGKMVDIDEASLLELRNLSDDLKKQEIDQLINKMLKKIN